jgi:outer membrane protein assembly factor BamB
MDCRIDINNIETEDRTTSILYATHDFIVYQERNSIVLASCDGTKLSDVKISIDYLNYECLDLDDALLFVFNGTDILVLDKSGMTPVVSKLNPITIGRCVSKIYKFPETENQIIFGTQQIGRIQFANYDFMENSRVAQTPSWNVAKVTDTLLVDKILYAVLDKSTIVAVDMSTGELLWTKFETAEISPGLVTFDKYLIYTCHGLMKKTDGEETQSVRIPLMSVSSILHANDRNLYMTVNDNQNVICYDLVSDKLKWEIFGNNPILQSVLVKSSSNEDVISVRTKKHITLINVSSGKSEYNVRTNNIARIRKTGDHLLIQKSTGHSTLIPGIKND